MTPPQSRGSFDHRFYDAIDFDRASPSARPRRRRPPGSRDLRALEPTTGLNSRLLDFTARLDEVVEFAIAQRVDLFLFAGDAYRSRDPSPTQQREFARRVRRLSEAGIPTFLLVGNHDLPNASGRANSLDIFETLAVPHVTVGRSPRLYRVETKAGPVQIAALPWLRRSALMAREEYRGLTAEEARQAIQQRAGEVIQNAADQLDPSLPAILAAHISVEGATYGSERSVLIGEDIVLPKSTVADPRFQYVALGHIHKYQVLNPDPADCLPRLARARRLRRGARPEGLRDGRDRGPAGAPHLPSPRRAPLRDDPGAAALGRADRGGPGQHHRGRAGRRDRAPDRRGRARRRRAHRLRRCAPRAEGRLLHRRHQAGGQPARPAAARRRGIESMAPGDALEAYLRARELPDDRRELLLRYGRQLAGEAP